MLVNHSLSLEDEIDQLGPEPKRKRKAPERIAQQAVVAWLRQVLPRGSKVAAIVNEQASKAKRGFAQARFHQSRKKAGVLDGMPDLVLVLPGGLTAWIEMKAPKNGLLSGAQVALHADFNQLGHLVGCATCIETARWLLHQWAIPLREAAGQPMRAAVVRADKSKPRLSADEIPF